MPIPWRFSFLGDSGNQGMVICYTSGISGKPKEFRGVFCFIFEVSLKVFFTQKKKKSKFFENKNDYGFHD